MASLYDAKRQVRAGAPRGKGQARPALVCVTNRVAAYSAAIAASTLILAARRAGAIAASSPANAAAAT
jgi:hypothetical protein